MSQGDDPDCGLNIDFSGNYEDVAERLRKAGFKGFKTIASLKESCREIPTATGVYIVLRKSDIDPEFLEIGSGGYAKEDSKDHTNVSLDTLIDAWVDGSPVMYIGKTEGQKGLRGRIRPYMRYGKGKKAAHGGGRYIWQLADADDLIVCWWETADNSREVEAEMIRIFKRRFAGKRPFANLAD